MSPKFMGFIIIHYSKIFKFSYVRINVHVKHYKLIVGLQNL